MNFRISIATALTMLGTVIATPALADYQLCNRTSYVLDGAIAFQEGEDWKSRGWVRLAPGECGVALAGAIAGGDCYVFARSIEVHQGRTQYFSGNERFCTADGSFEIEGRDQCAVRGYDANEFLPVRTEPGDDWVTTFSEASDHTAEQAQIAGAQRLLQDNGFKLARIDGIAARNTIRAVEAYQRSIGVAASGQIDALLIERLMAARGGAGEVGPRSLQQDGASHMERHRLPHDRRRHVERLGSHRARPVPQGDQGQADGTRIFRLCRDGGRPGSSGAIRGRPIGMVG